MNKHGLDAPITPGEFSDEIDPVAARRLFQSIILNAFRDACLVPPKPAPGNPPKSWKPSKKSKCTHEEAWARYRSGRRERIKRDILARDQARAWLMGNSEDFLKFCAFAGYEHEYIQRKAMRLASLGWPRMKMERRAPQDTRVKSGTPKHLPAEPSMSVVGSSATMV